MAPCRKSNAVHAGLRRSLLPAATALALAAASAPVLAVSSVESNSSIPFSFSNPGARSLGMGGAFLGLADDATAAYTNPAGLTGLGLEKQFSIEVRDLSWDDSYAASGTAFGAPFDLSGVSYGSASESSTDISFLSFVWPGEDWSLAVYRHQLVSYQNQFETAPIRLEVPGFFSDLFGIQGVTDLDIVNYGASFGWRVNDALSIGAGLSWYDFDIDTSSRRYDTEGTVGDPASLVNEQVQSGGDNDLGYNLGLLYRGSDNFQIGLAYRSAPEFEHRLLNVAGAANAQPGFVFLDREVSFEAPDMLGVGFAWRASDAMTLTLDINRINYSNLTDPVVSGFFAEDELSPAQREVLGRLQIDDVIEPHVGFEYVMLDMQRPLSLRLGAWYEDRHNINFEGDLNEFASFGPEAQLEALAFATVFSAGEDQLHYSLGLGWAFSSFQVDFAADFSDRQDILSLSGVWRF